MTNRSEDSSDMEGLIALWKKFDTDEKGHLPQNRVEELVKAAVSQLTTESVEISSAIAVDDFPISPLLAHQDGHAANSTTFPSRLPTSLSATGTDAVRGILHIVLDKLETNDGVAKSYFLKNIARIITDAKRTQILDGLQNVKVRNLTSVRSNTTGGSTGRTSFTSSQRGSFYNSRTSFNGDRSSGKGDSELEDIDIDENFIAPPKQRHSFEQNENETCAGQISNQYRQIEHFKLDFVTRLHERNVVLERENASQQERIRMLEEQLKQRLAEIERLNTQIPPSNSAPTHPAAAPTEPSHSLSPSQPPSTSPNQQKPLARKERQQFQRRPLKINCTFPWVDQKGWKETRSSKDVQYSDLQKFANEEFSKRYLITFFDSHETKQTYQIENQEDLANAIIFAQKANVDALELNIKTQSYEQLLKENETLQKKVKKSREKAEKSRKELTKFKNMTKLGGVLGHPPKSNFQNPSYESELSYTRESSNRATKKKKNYKKLATLDRAFDNASDRVKSSETRHHHQRRSKMSKSSPKRSSSNDPNRVKPQTQRIQTRGDGSDKPKRERDKGGGTRHRSHSEHHRRRSSNRKRETPRRTRPPTIPPTDEQGLITVRGTGTTSMDRVAKPL